MNKFNYFVGIDVSKESFNAAFQYNSKTYHQNFEHSKKGLKALLKLLRVNKIALNQTLFCMEHTGIYFRSLTRLMLNEKLALWVEMAYKIKHSIGLVRGKSDKADALVIANYAARFVDKAELSKDGLSPKYDKLKDLLAQRDRLILLKSIILKPVEELKKMKIEHAQEMLNAVNDSLKGVEKSLKKTEFLINTWLDENPEDHKQILRIQSVPGIGKISAYDLWATTEGMFKCSNAKQLACYSGVAPFKNQSGTSIYKKTAVSHMATKK